MATNNNINFADFTSLPVETHANLAGASQTVRVLTPHKGELLVDLQYKDWLGTHDKLLSTVIEDLRIHEQDAKDYLLKEWLSTTAPKEH